MSDKILVEALDKLTQIAESDYRKSDPEFGSATPRQKQFVSDLFVVAVAWSQTDHEKVLVSANSREEAEEIVKETLSGIHHITGTSEIHIRL